MRHDIFYNVLHHKWNKFVSELFILTSFSPGRRGISSNLLSMSTSSLQSINTFSGMRTSIVGRAFENSFHKRSVI